MPPEGYTIAKRKGHAPRVHLLTPSKECGTNAAEVSIKVEGGREMVLRELSKMGYRRATSCKRCFPQSEQQSEENTGERVEDDTE